MSQLQRAITFDLDLANRLCLEEALPGWQFENVQGAATSPPATGWSPGAVDLLVIQAEDARTAVGLCRALVGRGVYSTGAAEEVTDPTNLHRGRRSSGRRTDAPILVLVAAGQDDQVRAVLEAGADGCLFLPTHPKAVAAAVARMGTANQEGRHTLHLDRAQSANRWQDQGGEG
jgi:CheY-like chemotaxis protein